jgi:signal transduction histidine kinase
MRTLTFRLTIWYACVVTLTVTAILLAGRFYLEAHLMKGVDFLNDAEFEEIHHRLKSEAVSDDPEAVAEAIRLHTEIDASLFFFQVYDRDGQVVFLSSNMAGHSLPEEALGHDGISIRDDELGHLRVGEYKYDGLDIHIASSLQSVDAIFADAWSVILQIVVLVFLVSLVFGILMSRIALNPIRNIQSIARRISAHNLSERIPVPPGGDELSQLSTFLNEMFSRLEGAFNQISRFTADASHELRTPLSLIRLHSEKLIQNPDMPAEERLGALSEQMGEIDRLNKMIDDLLFIAKADAGVFKLSPKTVDTHRFVTDFGEDARLLCEEKGLRLEIEEPDGEAGISMDPVWMRHVLLNLLSNAMRYSPDGATIRLYSQPATENRWSFILEDEGPGIPEAALGRIFERFHRHAANDGNGESTGTGLGLAICQSIVAKHNGRIYASARPGGSGLRVHVELPLGA